MTPPRIDVRRLGKWADGCWAITEHGTPVGLTWLDERGGGPWYLDPNEHTTGPLLLAAVCEACNLAQTYGVSAVISWPCEGGARLVLGRGDGPACDAKETGGGWVVVDLPADAPDNVSLRDALLWVADQVLPEVSP